MKERPIPFSGPMVTALLDGRKTQTRRVIKRLRKFGSFSGNVTELDVSDTKGYDWQFRDKDMRWHDMSNEKVLGLCPHGIQGDKLWVRETWGIGSRPAPFGGYDGIEYRADEAMIDEGDDLPCYKVDTPNGICLGDYRPGWKSPMFMHRWASRILLEITNVRVERLRDICFADAEAEGWPSREPNGEPNRLDPISWYKMTWESINGKGSWDINPWVFVIEFKRIG